MIATSRREGLIIAGRPHAMAALDELVARCGWPVLRPAGPRQLRDAVLNEPPRLTLFWLDHDLDMTGTLRTLTWLAAYRPAIRRAVVGYQLSSDVEIAVRSAGAQAYLAATGSTGALVSGSVFQWLSGELLSAGRYDEQPYAGEPAVGTGCYPREPP